MPDESTILKSYYEKDTYLIFVTPDSRIETCLVFRGDSHVGTRIDFADLPWPLRNQYEATINPFSQHD